MKKQIIILLTLIIVAILIFLGVGYSKSLENSDKLSKITEFKIEKDEVKLGEKIAVSATFYSSWHNPDYSDEVISKSPHQSKKISFIGIGLGKIKWEYEITFIPFKNGDLELGEINILNKNGEGIKCKLPKILVHPMDLKDDNLVIAGEVIETPMSKLEKLWEEHKILIICILTVFILILGYIFYLWKRKQVPIPIVIPIWVSALDKISGLEQKVKAHSIENNKAVSELTDIARLYLEKRFKLKSTTETTEEFLRTLNLENSPLSENHKEFLQKFMSSAELIKFANLAADIAIVTNAINDANILIKETIPSEESPK